MAAAWPVARDLAVERLDPVLAQPRAARRRPGGGRTGRITGPEVAHRAWHGLDPAVDVVEARGGLTVTSAPRSWSLSTGTSTSSKGTSSSSGLWQTRMGGRVASGRPRSPATGPAACSTAAVEALAALFELAEDVRDGRRVVERDRRAVLVGDGGERSGLAGHRDVPGGDRGRRARPARSCHVHGAVGHLVAVEPVLDVDREVRGELVEVLVELDPRVEVRPRVGGRRVRRDPLEPEQATAVTVPARPARVTAAPGRRDNSPSRRKETALDQRLSLITLGVRDVSRAQAFYEALGWHRDGGVDDDTDHVAFFQAPASSSPCGTGQARRRQRVSPTAAAGAA